MPARDLLSAHPPACLQSGKARLYDVQQACFSVSAYDPETESFLIPMQEIGEQAPFIPT
jgi:hypothetical protein